MRFRSLIALLALGPFAGVPLSLSAPTPAPDSGGTRIGDRQVPASDEEAANLLKTLMPGWAATANRYEQYALRFLSTETHRNIDYSRSAGEARKEKEVRYGYLLTVDPKNSAYEVIRQGLDAEGRPNGTEKTIDLPCPEPYLWTTVFLPTTASTLKFHYLGREIQNYRLTYVVGFEGSAPRLQRKDIREWSGTVWVEENTGDIVRVEARPNFQNELMLALWREFQQSFAFLGMHSRARPHGFELATVFDFERDGLLFPSRLDLTDLTWVAINHEAIDSRLVLTYDDYRFFRTATEETVQPVGSPHP